MHMLLTVAFVLSLLIPTTGSVHAQAAGGTGGSNAGTGGGETGGTTGILTTTPGAKSEDASGTRGTAVTPSDSSAVDSSAEDDDDDDHDCTATQMWDESTKACVAK
jgi:hypothetical protein